jgi:hypothetical protein
MELAYAFLAKAAQFSEDGGLGIIGGDLQSLQGAIPYTPDSLVLVAKFEFGNEDSGHLYNFRLQVLDPAGEEKASTQLPVEPPRNNREKVGAIILLDLSHIPFMSEGIYQFRLLLEDKPLKTLELTLFSEVGTPEPATT